MYILGRTGFPNSTEEDILATYDNNITLNVCHWSVMKTFVMLALHWGFNMQFEECGIAYILPMYIIHKNCMEGEHIYMGTTLKKSSCCVGILILLSSLLLSSISPCKLENKIFTKFQPHNQYRH